MSNRGGSSWKLFEQMRSYRPGQREEVEEGSHHREIRGGSQQALGAHVEKTEKLQKGRTHIDM